ncbi:hydantoinase/oxoprolinase family protein [Bordetella pertussis]
MSSVGDGGGSSRLGWTKLGVAEGGGTRARVPRPGPVCYGKGGTKPTITDAFAVMGGVIGLAATAATTRWSRSTSRRRAGSIEAAGRKNWAPTCCGPRGHRQRGRWSSFVRGRERVISRFGIDPRCCSA